MTAASNTQTKKCQDKNKTNRRPGRGPTYHSFGTPLAGPLVVARVALTYAAVWVIALAAGQAGRPELMRSRRLVLAHVWEGMQL